MTKLYETKEWKGYGKQNYYWNEYWLDGDAVIKLKCNRHKFFDGDENTWNESKEEEQRWNIDDPNLPEWIRNYL